MPTARPADANTAMNEVVSMPSMPMMIMIRKSVSVMLTMLERKPLSEGSTSRRVIMLRIARRIQRMIQRPTASRTNAMRMRRPKLTMSLISMLIRSWADMCDSMSSFCSITAFFVVSATASVAAISCKIVMVS